ncbi:MAG: EAL domain-containing protein, partial [Thiohalocapsa sp.]
IRKGTLTVEIRRELLSRHPAELGRLEIALREQGHGLLLECVGLADGALLRQHARSLTHIKLDPTLIHGLAAGEVDESDVGALIRIARHHGLEAIALAVDGANVLPHLFALGVDAIQGYFVSKPNEDPVYPDAFSVDMELMPKP